jgi:hypothetical protein
MRSVDMRIAVLIWGVLLAVSCSPVVEPKESPAVARLMPPVEMIPPALAKPELASHSAEPPRAIRGEFSGITFEGVAFDSRSHRLAVIDQAGGPGSRFPDAAQAAVSVGGLAAVNGGFFTPEGGPLGLVIAAGKRSGAWNSASSLGSGIWHADASGFSAISRRDKLGESGAAALRELLQAGPMLVENGRAVSGLDPHKTSARTVILWDGGSRWWIGRCSPASLAQAAATLASGPVPGWPVRHALNLDGGRSSDLWISGAVAGSSVSRRPAWNRPVRNFLVLLPTS